MKQSIKALEKSLVNAKRVLGIGGDESGGRDGI